MNYSYGTWNSALLECAGFSMRTRAYHRQEAPKERHHPEHGGIGPLRRGGGAKGLTAKWTPLPSRTAHTASRWRNRSRSDTQSTEIFSALGYLEGATKDSARSRGYGG